MDLSNAIVKIIIYTDKVTYYCTFIPVINRYSKKFRAVSGDSKCKIDKSLYSGILRFEECARKI